jgi:hypothetical protein
MSFKVGDKVKIIKLPLKGDITKTQTLDDYLSSSLNVNLELFSEVKNCTYVISKLEFSDDKYELARVITEDKISRDSFKDMYVFVNWVEKV